MSNNIALDYEDCYDIAEWCDTDKAWKLPSENENSSKIDFYNDQTEMTTKVYSCWSSSSILVGILLILLFFILFAGVYIYNNVLKPLDTFNIVVFVVILGLKIPALVFMFLKQYNKSLVLFAIMMFLNIIFLVTSVINSTINPSSDLETERTVMVCISVLFLFAFASLVAYVWTLNELDQKTSIDQRFNHMVHNRLGNLVTKQVGVEQGHEDDFDMEGKQEAQQMNSDYKQNQMPVNPKDNSDIEQVENYDSPIKPLRIQEQIEAKNKQNNLRNKYMRDMIHKNVKGEDDKKDDEKDKKGKNYLKSQLDKKEKEKTVELTQYKEVKSKEIKTVILDQSTNKKFDSKMNGRVNTEHMHEEEIIRNHYNFYKDYNDSGVHMKVIKMFDSFL